MQADIIFAQESLWPSKTAHVGHIYLPNERAKIHLATNVAGFKIKNLNFSLALDALTTLVRGLVVACGLRMQNITQFCMRNMHFRELGVLVVELEPDSVHLTDEVRDMNSYPSLDYS